MFYLPFQGETDLPKLRIVLAWQPLIRTKKWPGQNVIPGRFPFAFATDKTCIMCKQRYFVREYTNQENLYLCKLLNE